MVLSAALGRAEREELVSRNVARLVELPANERAEVQPWTLNELTRFLEAAHVDPLYPAFMLVALYGLRRGEVLGLRWCDVDLATETLRIRQQLQRVGGTLRLGPVKTKAGRRDLPLVDLARQILTEQGGPKGDLSDGLVFTTKNGHPVDPRNLLRSFQRICASRGVRSIRLHDLRHTNATMLMNLGVSPRNAQTILGHAHVSTTQQIYQHGSMQGRREALEEFQKLLHDAREIEGNSRRSRHIQPSRPDCVAKITSVLSGTPGRIRTCDHLVRSSVPLSSADRLTSVKQVAQRRARTWLLGCVAVSIAVKNDPQPNVGWRAIRLPERVGGWT